MPRIPSITSKNDVRPEHQGVADAVVKVFGSIRGPFSILLHSPRLAERLLPLVPYFREDSVVDARLRLIAILTAVREREAAYPWAAQVGQARKKGLREEVIDLIRTNGDPGKLPEDERDVLTYARQLLRTTRPDAALVEKLAKRYGHEWIVDLTAATHYFALVAGIANAFDLTPPPDGDKLPA